MKKFKIIVTIQETDAVKFLDKKSKCEEDNKGKIIFSNVNTNAIAIQSGSGMGSMLVFSAYYEVECSEEAFKSWKFGQTLKN